MTLPLSRRALIAGLALALSSRSQAQERRPAWSHGNRPAEIVEDPRASSFDLGPDQSAWRILVGLPTVPPPSRGYSALIALDGNATFPMLWRHRAATAADAPVVLIGIGYPVASRFDTDRRWFDLTSAELRPADPLAGGRRGPGDRKTGGREAFLDMIANRLLPELRRRLPLDPEDMTLFGHSLGGLFVLHALFTRPGLFRRFAAADPSIWWNAGEMLREAASFAGGVAAAGGRIAPEIKLLIATSGGWGEETTPAPRQPGAPDIVAALSGIEGLDLD
ncbi:hypothetical protein SAMN04487972_13322 [Paracoccus halophilus]|uniref:Acyl-CoA:diacylglycerol acyltransferase n=1 Tax=Paracoccus halophilus TaxID=376733 RepID=A0A1I0UB24_9RHOB|nr:alpha/beta hydrolase-fold protein [Paracoccus halophilus]SFA61110.1 hypothetical protein SAMN04487972_13322 [Paracoccus halophilus]